MQHTPSFMATLFAEKADLTVRLVHQDERLGLGRTVAASPHSSLCTAGLGHAGTPEARANVYHMANTWT